MQVMACLRQGTITEGPYRDIKGSWRCAMERLIAGDEVKVAVALDLPAGLLIIITVM